MYDNPSDQAKVKCYGNAAALTVEATKLLQKGEVVGVTVNLEMAPIANRQADWSRKITIQLSEDELPVFASVLLGYLPKCEFKRPGKGIFIERQASKMFYKATQGSGNHFVMPVPIGQTFRVSSLVLNQLSAQSGLQDGQLIMAAIKGSAGLYRLQA